MSAVFFFYCGVLAQAFFLIRKKLTLSHYILIPATFLFCFLLALIPGSKESEYNTYLHLFMGAFIFSIAYSVWFKKDILQRVRKEVLFIWFFILLSLVMKDFTMAFLVPTLIVTALSLPIILGMFFSLAERPGVRIYSYVWFLGVLLFVASSQFIFSDISFFYKNGEGLPELSLSMIFVGSSFLYMMVNFWYLFDIIPIPAKRQSMSERLEEVREHLAMLGEKYDAKAKSTSRSSLFTWICCALITLNFFFPFIKTEIMIAMAVTVLPYLSSLLDQEEFGSVPSGGEEKVRAFSSFSPSSSFSSSSTSSPQTTGGEKAMNILPNDIKEILASAPGGAVRVTKTVTTRPHDGEKLLHFFPSILPSKLVSTETKTETSFKILPSTPSGSEARSEEVSSSTPSESVRVEKTFSIKI
jgi:hypothetical protein